MALMAARVVSLAIILAARFQHIVQGGRELQDRRDGQPFSDVTWRVCSGQGCSCKTASVLTACTICTSTSSGLLSMLKATVNVVASLVWPCS